MKKWFYPLISLLIFATLWAVVPLGSMGLAMGLVIFALMVTSSIQLVLDKDSTSGIQALATTFIGLVIAIVGHVAMSFTGFSALLAGTMTSVTGFIALIGFAFVVSMVAFQLSNKSANYLKDKTTKFGQGKVQTWTNNILLVSLTATFAHILAFDFLRHNAPFMALVGLYFVVAVASSIMEKVKNRKLAQVQ